MLDVGFECVRKPIQILSKAERMNQNPTIGLVSLGCPKALVDSERILTTLRAQGYNFSQSYEGADLVIVNTCGFLDSAKAESLRRSAKHQRKWQSRGHRLFGH